MRQTQRETTLPRNKISIICYTASTFGQPRPRQNSNKPVRNARWCRGGHLAHCAVAPLVHHHEEIITKGKQFEESQELGLRGCGSRNVREINFANTEHNTNYRVKSWMPKICRCLTDQPQSLPRPRHQRGGRVGSRGGRASTVRWCHRGVPLLSHTNQQFGFGCPWHPQQYNHAQRVNQSAN